MNNVTNSTANKPANDPSTITAAIRFLMRQSRKERPDGKTDRAGRFYPSESEKCDCCNGLSSPTRAYPMTLLSHCRTAKHVSRKYNVDTKAMREMVKFIEENHIDFSAQDATRLVIALLIDTSTLDQMKRNRKKHLI